VLELSLSNEMRMSSGELLGGTGVTAIFCPKLVQVRAAKLKSDADRDEPSGLIHATSQPESRLSFSNESNDDNTVSNPVRSARSPRLSITTISLYST
jgi:hypothetical protein